MRVTPTSRGIALRATAAAVLLGATALGLAGCASHQRDSAAVPATATPLPQSLTWTASTMTIDEPFLLVPRDDHEKVSVLHCDIVAQGDIAALYFRATNAAADADVLLSADAESVGAVDSHVDGNTFEVPAHGQAALVPGGNHVMLSDLHRPLMPGDSVWVTFHFKVAGDVRVRAVARALPG